MTKSRFATGGAGGFVTFPMRNGNNALSKISHAGRSKRSSWNTINDVVGSTTKSVYTMYGLMVKPKQIFTPPDSLHVHVMTGLSGDEAS